MIQQVQQLDTQPEYDTAGASGSQEVIGGRDCGSSSSSSAIPILPATEEIATSSRTTVEAAAAHEVSMPPDGDERLLAICTLEEDCALGAHDGSIDIKARPDTVCRKDAVSLHTFRQALEAVWSLVEASSEQRTEEALASYRIHRLMYGVDAATITADSGEATALFAFTAVSI
ncbi:hypothetical protein CEUSTIGMA_g4731.t1 [Chlamydomonas eustigma]|uniref:Uncharacterized protein n=1 Tax=Chlamydomonas eustigma TaxID=1157962 RepID=A0A250X2K4_9CHLO|nr:hypothetical protein CEUSTIGMA_g4731.t1 [Chlamydomonas eustigma]|eukprot:GAX77285.1 hypothetical protein CEUSTIGMA_g4731.t1 [Chlamydomonas eustigma]